MLLQNATKVNESLIKLEDFFFKYLKSLCWKLSGAAYILILKVDSFTLIVNIVYWLTLSLFYFKCSNCYNIHVKNIEINQVGQLNKCYFVLEKENICFVCKYTCNLLKICNYDEYLNTVKSISSVNNNK